MRTDRNGSVGLRRSCNIKYRMQIKDREQEIRCVGKIKDMNMMKYMTG